MSSNRSARTRSRAAWVALSLLGLLAVAACRTVDPRGSAMGTDYFRRDFSCQRGPLAQERNARYAAWVRGIRAQYKADTKKRGRARIVLTGDSTAMLFAQPLLDRELPDLRIVNRGMGGETSQLLLERLEDVTALRPEVVIVAIGGNDLLGGRCIEMVLANIGRLVERLRAGGVRRVILVSVPPVLTWKANSISPFFNYRLRMAADALGAEYLDLWRELAKADEPILKESYRLTLPGKRRPDAVHFNEDGYRAWARLIREVLSGNRR